MTWGPRVKVTKTGLPVPAGSEGNLARAAVEDDMNAVPGSGPTHELLCRWPKLPPPCTQVAGVHGVSEQRSPSRALALPTRLELNLRVR